MEQILYTSSIKDSQFIVWIRNYNVSSETRMILLDKSSMSYICSLSPEHIFYDADLNDYIVGFSRKYDSDRNNSSILSDNFTSCICILQNKTTNLPQSISFIYSSIDELEYFYKEYMNEDLHMLRIRRTRIQIYADIVNKMLLWRRMNTTGKNIISFHGVCEKKYTFMNSYLNAKERDKTNTSFTNQLYSLNYMLILSSVFRYRRNRNPLMKLFGIFALE